jgi:hypothetical protein
VGGERCVGSDQVGGQLGQVLAGLGRVGWVLERRQDLGAQPGEHRAGLGGLGGQGGGLLVQPLELG